MKIPNVKMISPMTVLIDKHVITPGVLPVLGVMPVHEQAMS